MKDEIIEIEDMKFSDELYQKNSKENTFTDKFQNGNGIGDDINESN